MDRKGRRNMAQGEQSGSARLKEIDIRVIRSSHASHVVLAKKYKVSPTHIFKIRVGETWAALPLGCGEHIWRPKTRLTPNSIARIRRARGTQREIARTFGICQARVSQIRAKETATP